MILTTTAALIGAVRIVKMTITHRAAEIMLSRGGWWTAADLGKEINVHSRYASGLLKKIRESHKYQTEETGLPGRKVKVISIGEPAKAGRKKKAVKSVNLWALALGVGR